MLTKLARLSTREPRLSFMKVPYPIETTLFVLLLAICNLPIINPSADGFGYNHSEARVDGENDERYVGFDSIDRMEAVLRPGDILFNPPWMWHSVENDAPTIGVRCGFIYPKGMVSASLTLTLTRPAFLKELAEQTGKNVAKLRVEYRDQKKREMLIGMLLENKVLDIIEAKAKIEEE